MFKELDFFGGEHGKVKATFSIDFRILHIKSTKLNDSSEKPH